MKHRHFFSSLALLLLTISGGMLPTGAQADVALAVRAGTFGYGADLDVGLNDYFAVRLGYNTLDYAHTLEDTDVTYDAKVKIGAASALLDWYVFAGGFHLTGGLVQKAPEFDVKGMPTGGTYELNGHVYTAAQIGSLDGTIELGNTNLPYLGMGWGNTVDKDSRLTFLLDIGAIKTGSPTATLNVNCGASVTTTVCNQIKTDVNAEKAELEANAADYKWYPVVSLGLAFRF